MLFSGSSDKTLKIWNLNSQTLIKSIEWFPLPLNSIEITSKYIIIACKKIYFLDSNDF
jgi:hypothetical protein